MHLRLSPSDNTTIENNTFNGSANEQFRFTALGVGSILRNNNFSNSSSTIINTPDSSTTAAIQNMNATNNFLDGAPLFVYSNLNNQIFKKSEIGEISSFTCANCNNITLDGFNFNSNPSVAIIFKDSEEINIKNCIFNGTSGKSFNKAIYITGSINVTLLNNSFINYLEAVQFGGENITLIGNSIGKSRTGLKIAGTNATLINNTIEDCLIPFDFSLVEGVYQGNIFKDNYDNSFLNDSVLFGLENRIFSIGEKINISFNVTNLNQTANTNFTYDLDIFPNTEVINISITGNNFEFSFIPTSSGLYGVQINITHNSTKDSFIRKYSLIIGEEKIGQRNLYFRSTDPLYGANDDLNGWDVGSFSSEAPISGEKAYCDDFFDFFEQPTYYPYLIKNYSFQAYVASAEEGIGYDFGYSYFDPSGVSSLFYFDEEFPSDYEIFNLGLPDLNLSSDYSWVQGNYLYYFQGSSFAGEPIIYSGPDRPSTLNISYYYSEPRVLTFYADDQRDINLLSSTMENLSVGNATIYLNGKVGEQGVIAIEMPNSSINYSANYDGISCAESDNCSINSNSEGIVNLTLTLGTLNEIEIYENVTAPVEEAEESEETTSSGSPQYPVTKENLAKGYSKNLKENWQLRFTKENQLHRVRINKINQENKTTTITVSSEPQTKTLEVGEEWKVNLEDDEYYDLLVKLNGIENDYANVSIQGINETIFVGEFNQSNGIQENQTNQSNEKTFPEELSSKRNILIYLVGFIILLIIISLTWLLKRIYSKKIKRNSNNI